MKLDEIREEYNMIKLTLNQIDQSRVSTNASCVVICDDDLPSKVDQMVTDFLWKAKTSKLSFNRFLE